MEKNSAWDLGFLVDVYKLIGSSYDKISINYLGKSPEITQPDLGSFGPNLGTRNARKSILASTASYSSLEYNQIWATILALCPGDDVIIEQQKKSKTYPFSKDTHRKPQT